MRLLHIALLASATLAVAPAAPPVHAAEPPAVQQRGEQVIAAEIEALQTTIAELEVRLGQVQGEDAEIAALQLQRRRAELASKLDELIDASEAEADRALAAAASEQLGEQLRAQFEALQIHVSGLRAGRAEAEDVVEVDGQVAVAEAHANEVLEAFAENVARRETLGANARADKRWLERTVALRGENVAERLQLRVSRLRELKVRLGQAPDSKKADIEEQIAIEIARRDRTAELLGSTAELMAAQGLDASEYEQLRAEATGQIPIQDVGALLGLLQKWGQKATDTVVEKGPGWVVNLIVFALILIVFRFLAGITRKLVRKGLGTSKLNFSNLLKDFFEGLAGKVVFAVGFLIALSQLGFQLGPILAGLGIAGFVLGFALQETLSNFAAGLMILVYRPFDVGDAVSVAGVTGKVHAMSLVSTTILTFDNQNLLVPNSKIWGDVITNITARDTRRVDMSFGIGYEDDIPKAEKLLNEIVSKHEKVLKDPEPTIKLSNLGDSSVDFVVRPWAKTDDYWDVFFDITREVKLRFDEEGVSIPFPQRDVHVYQERVETPVSV